MEQQLFKYGKHQEILILSCLGDKQSVGQLILRKNNFMHATTNSLSDTLVELVRGCAAVVLDDEMLTVELQPGETMFLPQQTLHRFENKSQNETVLELTHEPAYNQSAMTRKSNYITVQPGQYL